MQFGISMPFRPKGKYRKFLYSENAIGACQLSQDLPILAHSLTSRYSYGPSGHSKSYEVIAAFFVLFKTFIEQEMSIGDCPVFFVLRHTD